MNVLKALICVGLIYALVAYPDTVMSSASDALGTCFNILLPSLFPFFVLSRIFISSGGASILGRLMRPIMKPLFKINGNGAAVFILGIISGYPVGAKTAIDLYNQSSITKKEAENLVCFCNNSGPLFIMGALGAGMLSSQRAGIFLYIIHILSAVTVGFLLRFTIKYNSSPNMINKEARNNGLTVAVEESMISVINVFAYVIFFAIIMDVCKRAGTFALAEKLDILFNTDIASSIVYSVFEMTSGIKKLSASENTLSLKIILSSFMLGWSGLSVHMQTLSIVKKSNISFFKYIIAKLTQGIISSIYAFIGLKFIKIDTQVFFQYSNTITPNYNVPDLMLAATMIICAVYITAQLRSEYNIRYSRPKQKGAI